MGIVVNDLSTAEVGQKLGISTETVRNMIANGDFPNAYRLTRVFRVPFGDLRRYTEKRRVNKSGAK